MAKIMRARIPSSRRKGPGALRYFARHTRERCDCGGYYFPHRYSSGACFGNPRYNHLEGRTDTAGRYLMERAGLLALHL